MRVKSTTPIFILFSNRLHMAQMRQVHVFQTWEWSGIETESEEMIPKWFPEDSVPFDMMWPDDAYWFEYLLSNQNFNGRFVLTLTWSTLSE